jgi:hypothetical protein
MQRAQEIHAFFGAYPSMLRCLTKLSIHNAGFDKLDMHHVLFDCCKQLKHLSLSQCDTGDKSVFKIDAPSSKLCVLEVDKCRFERLDLVCLPRLEKFICTTWIYQYVIPGTLGCVPSLGELELSCVAFKDDQAFKLSELLQGVTSIHTLTLHFEGEIVSLFLFLLNLTFCIHRVVSTMRFISWMFLLPKLVFQIVLYYGRERVIENKHNCKFIDNLIYVLACYYFFFRWSALVTA